MIESIFKGHHFSIAASLLELAWPPFSSWRAGLGDNRAVRALIVICADVRAADLSVPADGRPCP